MSNKKLKYTKHHLDLALLYLNELIEASEKEGRQGIRASDINTFLPDILRFVLQRRRALRDNHLQGPMDDFGRSQLMSACKNLDRVLKTYIEGGFQSGD